MHIAYVGRIQIKQCFGKNTLHEFLLDDIVGNCSHNVGCIPRHYVASIKQTGEGKGLDYNN